MSQIVYSKDEYINLEGLPRKLPQEALEYAYDEICKFLSVEGRRYLYFKITKAIWHDVFRDVNKDICIHYGSREEVMELNAFLEICDLMEKMRLMKEEKVEEWFAKQNSPFRRLRRAAKTALRREAKVLADNLSKAIYRVIFALEKISSPEKLPIPYRRIQEVE